MKLTVQKFEKLFGAWYERHARDLPWRRTHDPYKIWVSEIMLQQTQVERVKDYYARFLERFPVVQDLAKAPWEDVLECWRGLGYYRRARNLQKAAQVIVQEYQGKFPRSFEELKSLPGIGSYTAAAIASFAFGEKVPALDTNISRVFERVFGDGWAALSPRERFDFARKHIGNFSGRDFNYGMMDLGALVCNARQPKCSECCFQGVCEFNSLPGKSSRGAWGSAEDLMPRENFFPANRISHRKIKATEGIDVLKVAAGVLIHEGKVLIAKRPKGKPLAGLWEFPGGKLEAREDERTCLKREFMEELGIEVSVRPPFHRAVTDHNGQTIKISFHRCSLLLGDIQSLEGQEFLWILPSELRNYEFPPANVEAIDILQTRKAMFMV